MENGLNINLCSVLYITTETEIALSKIELPEKVTRGDLSSSKQTSFDCVLIGVCSLLHFNAFSAWN
jgi:hypothetical protein